MIIPTKEFSIFYWKIQTFSFIYRFFYSNFTFLLPIIFFVYFYFFLFYVFSFCFAPFKLQMFDEALRHRRYIEMKKKRKQVARRTELTATKINQYSKLSIKMNFITFTTKQSCFFSSVTSYISFFYSFFVFCFCFWMNMFPMKMMSLSKFPKWKQKKMKKLDFFFIIFVFFSSFICWH